MMTPIKLQPTWNSSINNIGRDVYDENESTTFLTQPNIKQAQHLDTGYLVIVLVKVKKTQSKPWSNCMMVKANAGKLHANGEKLNFKSTMTSINKASVVLTRSYRELHSYIFQEYQQ